MIPIPRRTLGRTGASITLFGLGGEGILRTHGETPAAARVINRALDQGVSYCDTAPAYASSMDYYGAALGERRRDIFLASKTHIRSRDGSLKLLDDSLKRLRTDHLDLWQLHDLRTDDDLRQIFGKGGALEALIQARSEGRVRFLGITGHHDPQILLNAMKQFSFDTLLVAVNAADVHRASFIKTVLPEAVRQNLGVIAMKTCSQGALFDAMNMDEALGYAWSVPGVCHAIVGCKTETEVDDNARIARTFAPLDAATMRELEERTKTNHRSFAYYKKA